MEQFFAEYGEAYKQVFNEDDDDEKEDETGKEEREVEDEEEAEDKHVDNILQSKSALQVSDLKKKLLGDIKEILVCNKERSQVADIGRVVVESEEDKEAENLSTMFLVQSVVREKNIAPSEWLFKIKFVKYKCMLMVRNAKLSQQCSRRFSVKLLVI